MHIIFIFALYVIIVNIAGYASMGIDKRRARLRKYRISEASLFAIALLGGSLGSILGMQHFRHKTKHWYFVWGMPAILITQVVAVFFLINHFVTI